MAFKTIAVVDDDEETRMILYNYLLSEDGFNVKVFESGFALIEYCRTSTPDLILMDIEMPGLSGIETFDRIKAMKKMSAVPIVFLTGKEDRNTVLKCIGKGADGYMVKPVLRANLVSKIKEIFKKIDAYKSNYTVLMIDDDVEFLRLAKLKLSKYYKVLTVDSGKTAIDYLANHTVDIIILDYYMPLYNGNSLLNILKYRNATKNIPVIMASELTRESIEEVCAKNPPDGIMTKPINMDELLNTMQEFLEG